MDRDSNDVKTENGSQSVTAASPPQRSHACEFVVEAFVSRANDSLVAIPHLSAAIASMRYLPGTCSLRAVVHVKLNYTLMDDCLIRRPIP